MTNIPKNADMLGFLVKINFILYFCSHIMEMRHL